MNQIVHVAGCLAMKYRKLRIAWSMAWGISMMFLVVPIATAIPGCNSPQSERREAMQSMRHLVAQMHNHWRMQGQPGFPESDSHAADGSATCSWRLTVTDECEDGPDIAQSWKSPVNQNYYEQGAKLFAVTSRSNPSPFTQVFGLVGPGTAFTEYEYTKGRDSSNAEPDAILLIDAQNRLVHWKEPGDIHVEPLIAAHHALNLLEPNYPNGFLIAFVDGAVWWIKKDVPQEVIRPFFTVEGAKAHDREVELSPYALDKVPPLPKVDGKYVYPEPGQLVRATSENWLR